MPKITRRSVLQLSSLAALASLSSAAPHLSGAEVERALLAEPVHVPPDFLGMHLHRWPLGEPLSAAPTYQYGTVRSHDYSGGGPGIFWNSIHKADGVFDWSEMDPWVRANQSAGRALVYTVYGTPEWLAPATTHRDAYGRVGAGCSPRSLGPLAQFVSALVKRYNTQPGNGLRAIEIWNEPHFEHDYASFWWGTATELAAMGRVIYQAAKEADPDIRILSPGFDDNLTGGLSLQHTNLEAAQTSSLYQYLSASDGGAGRGGTWCDAIAFHTYEARIASASDGIEGQLLLLRRMLALMQLSLPVYCTECGFRSASSFASSTPETQAVMLRRLAAVLAANRIQGLYYYSHDDEYIGNPSHHPEIAVALGQIHSELAGRTLKQVTISSAGPVRVEAEHRTFTW